MKTYRALLSRREANEALRMKTQEAQDNLDAKSKLEAELSSIKQDHSTLIKASEQGAEQKETVLKQLEER